MCKWKTSQNDALGIWELSEKQISLHSHNVAPNAMVSNPFFLEKGVDIFLWLEVCTEYVYRWDSKSFATL